MNFKFAYDESHGFFVIRKKWNKKLVLKIWKGLPVNPGNKISCNMYDEDSW